MERHGVAHIDDRILDECGGSHDRIGNIDTISIDDWEFMVSHGPIATESEKDFLLNLSTRSVKSLPEQIYPQNVLQIRQKSSGRRFEFNATDALVQWMRDDDEKKNPVIQIGLSEQWQRDRQNILESVERVSYDWTYTTSYSGTLGDWAPQATQRQMNMRLLTDRSAPILMFDSLPLYVSELDDVGISEVSVKIRVMPSCWFVLLRFFLRIDKQLVKIRDTRYFCEFSEHVVVREMRHQESHDSTTVASCGDADQAASVLQALAPVGVTLYRMEEMAS
jgi:type 2A phosphatase activator TIP41